MTHGALGPGGEFDRIRGIIERLGAAAAPGLGDDCALLEWPGGTVVLSTDATIEDVHFRRSWLEPAEIGWRAAARALSDLAAEGADAVGVLVALAAPRDAGGAVIAEVMAGAGDAAGSVGARVLGGDLAAGDRWHIVVTVVGTASRPVTRTGAVPGDRLWLTGRLGGARAALDAWTAGREPDVASRRAFARPEPRIASGRALAAAGAHAMIDLSDGLGSDAAHIAAASAVRVLIDLDRVPIAAAEPPSRRAAGGDDYELLAAMPAAFDEGAADEIARRTGVPLTRVGRIEAGTGTRLLQNGTPVEAPGWDHFAPR